MRADFRADAVFKRRHDFAAGRVIFGVCAEHDGNVKLEAYGVALNLHVPLLHDVEQRNLDFAGQVRHLIDREDAAICPWQQPVVHGQLV